MNKASKQRLLQRLLGWDADKMRYNKKLINDIISDNNDDSGQDETGIDLKDFFTTFPYTNGEQLYSLLKKFIIEESDCYYLLLKYPVVTEQTIDNIKILNATQASVSGFSCKYIYPGATYFPNGSVNAAGKITGNGDNLTSEILLYYNTTEYPLRQILNVIPANSIQLIATNLQ